MNISVFFKVVFAEAQLGPQQNQPALRQDRNSLALRLHYLARAKPMEDERTIKAQHVAPGTWYAGNIERLFPPVNSHVDVWVDMEAWWIMQDFENPLEQKSRCFSLFSKLVFRLDMEWHENPWWNHGSCTHGGVTSWWRLKSDVFFFFFDEVLQSASKCWEQGGSHMGLGVTCCYH